MSLKKYTEIKQILNDRTLADITQQISMPKVFLSGDMMGMSSDVAVDLNMSYRSDLMSFDGVVNIKWQGTSSLNYPKKNFTIKMYTDATKSTKLYKNLKGWGNQYKFCLKANYIDHTHARNIVSARLWDEIVSERDTVSGLLATAPCNGAVDGYPIKLYINGVYQGIYTWNIPKDGWMFNMDSNNINHALLCAERHDGAGAFRALAVIDGTDWSLEFPSTLNNAIKTSFNAAITHVKDTDAASFKANLSQYFDVEACIDYYCYAYFMCHHDGLGKNMLMATYDGQHWIPSMYDMDSTWGLYWDGSSFVSSNYLCPEQYGCSTSLLWSKLEANYPQEIYDRYMYLRSTVLSFENIINRFERFIDAIPKPLYEEDVVIFTGIPSAATNNIQQIRKYMCDRAEYVDGQINALVHKNIFNPINLTNDTWISASNGSIHDEAGYYTSDYISASAETVYTFGNLSEYARMNFYNASKEWISGVEGLNYASGTSPANTRYIRLSYKKTETTPQLELGATVTSYVPYGS